MSTRIFEGCGDLINDTAMHSGRWRKLVALTDVVFASGTAAQDINGSFAGAQLNATAELIGTFTSIQLISGTAVAYF